MATSSYWEGVHRHVVFNESSFIFSNSKKKFSPPPNASAELTWIQFLLGELGISLPSAPILHCDNIGATYLTSNPMFLARKKCIAIDYHFVRDKVESNSLDVRFISGKDQVADILTKPLVSKKFTLLKSNLNVRSPSSKLRGVF
jgi:hypothetical protein